MSEDDLCPGLGRARRATGLGGLGGGLDSKVCVFAGAYRCFCMTWAEVWGNLGKAYGVFKHDIGRLRYRVRKASA